MRALRVLARMGVAVRAILVGSIILPAAAAEDMRVRR